MKQVKFKIVRIFPKKIVYDLDITFNHLMSICSTGDVMDVIWSGIRFRLTSIVKHDIKDIIINELNNPYAKFDL